MRKYETERVMCKDTLLKDGDYKSTKEVFERIAHYIPDTKIIGELNEKREIVYHTAKEILNDIENIGDGLIDLGLEDKHIVLLAENSYRYLICDMAIAGGVGVVTPIDKDAEESLLITLLKKCDADAIICSSYLIKKLEKILPECPNVKNVITIDKKVENYISLDEVMKKGESLKDKAYYKNKQLDLDKVCEILFTSGTTGANKAVMLTQNNLSANIINCGDMIKGETKDNTSMSILPMHHATEINTHIMPRIAFGRLTYISSSMKDMMTNIKIFKPYIITVVPMIANAFYKNIWLNAKKQGKEKKLKKGIKLCKLLRKFGCDITHKLFKDLYEPFGGNLRQMVCGGAPLDPEVVKGLTDLGIFIINGYGITECGPLVSMNTDTVKDTFSIGTCAPQLEAKIDSPDENGVGELCIRGKSVSKGYYKDPESTKMVFDEDGFFHTGDLAKQKKNGRLYMAGRKKNLIVLDNGKNVFPEELEQNIINEIKYIKEVVVFEDEIKFKNDFKKAICSIVVLDDENKNISTEQILNDFRKLNSNLANYKKIAYVEISETDFEKNPSRKIIRPLAYKKHSKTNGIII